MNNMDIDLEMALAMGLDIEEIDLHDEAVELAFGFFANPTDDHIATIHARLEFNRMCGLGSEGALTIH